MLYSLIISIQLDFFAFYRHILYRQLPNAPRSPAPAAPPRVRGQLPGFGGDGWGPGIPVPVELSPSPSLTQHPPTENTPLHSAGLS